VIEKKSSAAMPFSSLGYGCYALSGAYGSRPDECEMVRILQKAYDLGIRLFDTAGCYTGTEEILGKAVKSYRHDISIATKVGFTDDYGISLSKEAVLASCEASLKNLDTDYIDIYQVHYHDPDTCIEETIEALEYLSKAGKIRHYGIGHLPLDITEEYLRKGNVSYVLAEMSPVSTARYRELHPLQNIYGFDIIAFSITGRGILSGKINKRVQFSKDDIRSKDPLFIKSRLHSGINMASKLREIGSKYNMTPVQTAILWTLQNQGVAAGLTGPTKIDHLVENSKVLDMSLDEDSIMEINQMIEMEEDKLRQTVQDEVHAILTSPLSADYEKAYKDLIYVLEYSIENQYISYKNGVNIFMKIEEDRNSGSRSVRRLNDYREKIKAEASII